LLECEEWVEAHDILVEHIFPELVINEEHTKLKELIDRLKPYSELIPNWFISGAHLFDIYSHSVNPTEMDDQLLEEDFNFYLIKCTNNRQRLCVSEMARKINLLTQYTQFNRQKRLTPAPDYALKELLNEILVLIN